LRRALALLDRAAGLGVRTRAIHLRRSRYWGLLNDDAAREETARVRALATRTDLDPEDHFLVGHELFTRGELEPARQEFRRALQKDPRHFWTHYFLGICYVTAGKPEAAEAHLTSCLTRNPTLVWTYLLRGFARGQMKNHAGAEADFDRALALNPGPATLSVLSNTRGGIRVGRKEPRAEGIEDLKRAVAHRPDRYEAHASLAEAYRLDQQPDRASAHLADAVAAARRQLR